MQSYGLHFKKFLNSQHISTGLRITVCVLLPAYILYTNGMLRAMMAIPLGALFVAITDLPGPLHHRINGMIAAIVINFLLVCLAGASAGITWLLGIDILVLSFLFSMFGVYGARADAIGLIGIIVFIVSYGVLNTGTGSFIYPAVYFAAGGAWYALFSTITNTIQPYRLAAQLLGEYLVELGHYLQHRSGFYGHDADNAAIFRKMAPHQVKIQQYQANLRDLMFKTRVFVKQPTNKGRRLMMLFLESADLLERIMTTQQDYTQLHKEFDDSGILAIYQYNIRLLGNSLVYTGLAVQGDSSYNAVASMDAALGKSKQAFFDLRKQQLQPSNIGSFIRLRHVLHSIEDITERIRRIQDFTRSSTKVNRKVKKEEVTPFTISQDFNLRLLMSNLSLTSFQFRHALRVAVAMGIGFLVSLFFPLGHGYWILLAIATILKPAFSASKKNNIARVVGTLVGVGLAFATLYATIDHTALFMVMLVSMLVAYTSLRLNNMISTAGITVYVVISFHFLYPAGLDAVLRERIIDTVIGAAIALPTSYFILPFWERHNMPALLTMAVNSNKEYFESVTAFFYSKDITVALRYKLARRAAFVALANVSDALQKMLGEPKNQQECLAEYHQLVTANHMLTSYIASLAYYAEAYNGQYDVNDFKPMMQYVCRQFALLHQVAGQPGMMLQKPDPFPVNKRLKDLMAQRQKELQDSTNLDASTVSATVSVMKTITDQLQLINSGVEDMMKVLSKIT